MFARKGRRNQGFTLAEALTVVAVIALLFGLGFLLYRSMRRGARVASAEARLKQVAAGLELYFRDNQAYPDEGADLQVALAPYLDDPMVFDNPLRDDDLPGEDLNQYYRQPSLQVLDRPGYYVVCFPPGTEDDPITVLETGDRVTRRINPGYDAEHLQRDTLLAFLYPQPQVTGDASDPGGGSGDDTADVPEDPTTTSSPDDYTSEPQDGVICLSESADCYESTVEVAEAEVTSGQGSGTELPITIEVDFLSGSGGRASWPLFNGQPVHRGDRQSFLLEESSTFALRFQAEGNQWVIDMTSDGDPTYVLTLRRGDRPAEFDPYGNPKTIRPVLSQFLDPATGEVTIDDNQVLYLVEFGNAPSWADSYDLQDLVVVLSLDEPPSPEECVDAVSADGLMASEEEGGFDIGDGGDVVTQERSDVLVRVVGSQFGYADGTMVDVGCASQVDDPENPDDGEWVAFNGGAPVQGGEEYNDDDVSAGTRVTVQGEVLGAYERWLWTQYGYPLSYRSDEGTDQVLVYQNGDQPPDFAPGFPCQASAQDLVAAYIDPQTGVVTIEDNQVLYLWDFNPTEMGEGIDYQDLIVLATAEATGGGQQGQGTPEPPANQALSGRINLNPRNNWDFQFELETPDGTITRDDLHASNGDLTYQGEATSIRFCPKGNGNQNSLTLDGEPYSVDNGTLYTITSDDMTVNLYNDKADNNGKAMGRWWIEIDAASAEINGQKGNKGGRKGGKKH